jgi:hypothetical protein
MSLCAAPCLPRCVAQVCLRAFHIDPVVESQGSVLLDKLSEQFNEDSGVCSPPPPHAVLMDG